MENFNSSSQLLTIFIQSESPPNLKITTKALYIGFANPNELPITLDITFAYTFLWSFFRFQVICPLYSKSMQHLYNPTPVFQLTSDRTAMELYIPVIALSLSMR